MSFSNAPEPQPFFIIANADTGEIYCVHQEYSVKGRKFLTSHEDEERLLGIALKANPACEGIKDKLKVFPLMCSPAINFSEHHVDLKTGELVKRKA